MNNQVGDSLRQRFEKCKIVFRYDEKIELLNNEFGVQYRILREETALEYLCHLGTHNPDPA